MNGLRYLSVCSGIEAATVAWHPLGWTPAAFSEIEPFPRAVLAHHYPGVPLHGDFTTIGADDYGPIDLLVGGTPCQSFSIVGLRAGLDDDRGNLALEFCRLAQRKRPRWVVWENVPGVLSLDGGRAFASILGGLADCGYGLAYRVLDAQFVRVDGFGRAVPQRRRRVFVVGYLGDWRRAAAVLFERQGLLRNTPPRRKPGQNPAPTLSARTQGGGGLGTDFDAAANAEDQETYVPVPLNDLGGAAHALTATATATGHLDATTQDFLGVAHALRGTGFDASEDGTGRGTPLVAVAGTLGSNGKAAGSATLQDAEAGLLLPICFDETQITSAENRSQPGPGQPSHPLSSQARPPAVAFRTTGNDGVYETGDVSPCLNTATDPNQITLLQQWRVRRLMPVECERLQGFPDNYTLIPGAASGGWRDVDETEDVEALREAGMPVRLKGNVWRVKDPDGPRYKALGNSMAVNVMRWIGRRIEMVERIAVRDVA